MANKQDVAILAQFVKTVLNAMEPLNNPPAFGLVSNRSLFGNSYHIELTPWQKGQLQDTINRLENSAYQSLNSKPKM